MVRQASSFNGFGLSIRRGKSFMEMIIWSDSTFSNCSLHFKTFASKHFYLIFSIYWILMWPSHVTTKPAEVKYMLNNIWRIQKFWICLKLNEAHYRLLTQRNTLNFLFLLKWVTPEVTHFMTFSIYSFTIFSLYSLSYQWLHFQLIMLQSDSLLYQ